jgi:ABC-type bacteriocin/lantibiotic exporter with double-glycine peptidase domain
MLGVMILLIPLNAVITMKLRNIQKKQMVTKDARIKMMNEVLNGVKVIKLSAWENSFLESITDIRETELSQLQSAAFIRSVVSFLWAAGMCVCCCCRCCCCCCCCCCCFCWR